MLWHYDIVDIYSQVFLTGQEEIETAHELLKVS